MLVLLRVSPGAGIESLPAYLLFEVPHKSAQIQEGRGADSASRKGEGEATHTGKGRNSMVAIIGNKPPQQ